MPIMHCGFAQTATHFYVFGGVSNGIRTNAVWRWDIVNQFWQSRAAMPFANASEAPTCALMPGTNLVYCTEGDTGNGFASYDIVNDQWTMLASPGFADYLGSASGALNGKVFVAGGGATGSRRELEVYDVATDTWSFGEQPPSDFVLAGYQQLGQYLYVVGGFDAGSPGANKTTTWRLDMTRPPDMWWSVGPAFTQARADFGLPYDPACNRLYAIGGDATGGGFSDSTNLVDELDVGSWPGGTWTASPPNLLLPNRQANQAGFYGAGQIWTVGGIVGQTSQYLAEVQHRINSCVSCRLRASPTPRFHPTIPPRPTPATPTPTATGTPSPTPTPTASPIVAPRPRPSPPPRP